jgi:hypothetical protein
MLKTERLESQIILKILRAKQLLGTVNFKRYIFPNLKSFITQHGNMTFSKTLLMWL